MKPTVWLAHRVIDTWRVTFGVLIGPSCRYQPTCSAYAKEAIATHGLMRGSILAAGRILRCHPWGGHGFDPVPRKAPQTRK